MAQAMITNYNGYSMQSMHKDKMMFKISQSVRHAVTPRDHVYDNCSQPQVVMLGDQKRIVCQYSGILSAKSYYVKLQGKTYGYFCHPQLATELFAEMYPDLSCDEIVADELEADTCTVTTFPKSAPKKKPLPVVPCFVCFKKNIEAKSVKNIDAIVRQEFDGATNLFLFVAPGDKLRAYSNKPINSETFFKFLAESDENNVPSVSLTNKVLVMCSLSEVKKYKRLKIAHDECHKLRIKLPGKKRTELTKLREKIQKEKHKVKEERKYGLKPLYNVSRKKLPVRTPKRLIDAMNGVTPRPAPKRRIKPTVVEEIIASGHIDKHSDSTLLGASSS